MSDLKTKLYDTHISLGGHMVSFGGYLLPIHFSGINHEHEIVRSKVGLFDVSHMGEFIISGNDALSFLQRVTVNDIELLNVGQAQYSAMCYDDGGIIDDLIVYRQEDHYMMVVNASNREKNIKWLEKNCEYNVHLEDISDDMGLIAVQGPRSREVIQKCIEDPSIIENENLPFMGFISTKLK